MIEPGLSSVVTYTPAGAQPRHLGALGHVENLAYSWVNPGGAEQLTCLLQLPADYRTDALNPGRICKVWRGGACVWDGKLLEPTVDKTGWTVTATGIGTAGADFRAIYTSAWGSAGSQNDAVNQAIGRGLRWVNPGIPSSVWFGQQVDSAADTIADLLNLFCTRGSLTWYVTTGTYGNTLSVYAFPQNPTPAQANRILVSTTPVSRTLGGDINALYGRYQTSPDAATAATYALTSVTQPASITAHGRVEDYDDLSSSGQEPLATVQAALQSVLNRYQRASFGGPFTVRPGQYLNIGGVPVDLGIDQCGTIARLILADFGYGGEVIPDPVVFMVGHYQWDEQAQQAQVTPFQSLDLSMSGLLQEIATVLPKYKPKPKHHKPVVIPGGPMITGTPHRKPRVIPGGPMIPAPHHKRPAPRVNPGGPVRGLRPGKRK